MVRALAGDSTITRCLAMAARSVAPGPRCPSSAARRARPRPGGRRVRCRGPAGGSPRRSRGRSRRRPRRASVAPPSGDREQGLLVGAPARPTGVVAAFGAAPVAGALARRRARRACGISRNRMMWYGKKNVELDLVDEHRAACRPSCAGSCTAAPASSGGRQLEQVAEQRLLVRGMDDDVSDHAAMLARAARRHRPMVTAPDGPPARSRADAIRGGRSRSPAGRGRRTQTPIPTRSYAGFIRFR